MGDSHFAAVLYARQSSGDEELSMSVENQLEKCREAFRDDRLVVFVAGKNPLPGASSGIVRASARTKRRRELAEVEL